MRQPFSLGVAVIAVAAVTSASAADLPAKAPVFKAPAAAGFTWQGYYLGINAGAAASGTKLTTDPSTLIGNNNGDNSDISKTGFTGGVQFGYNWQPARNWVLGVEGDVGGLSTSRSMCNINDCSDGSPLNFSSKSNFLATARGRLGYAWDRSLLYVTGGAAWVGVKDSWTFFTPTTSERSATRAGWALGGGLETALAGNWSAKVEYLFIDAGTNRVNDAGGGAAYMDFAHRYQLARFGLNYRLGGQAGGVATPVVAAVTHNWNGFYAGVNAGAGAAGTQVKTDPTTLIGSGKPTEADDLFRLGFTGGGQVGYNFQFAPNWVAGVEGDVGALSTRRNICDINDCSIGFPIKISSKSSFLATARGRFGYAWDRSLLYVTGGAAWVGVKDSWTFFRPAPASEHSATKAGWTVGGGIETVLVGNLSAKLEYLYVNAGTNRVTDTASGTAAYMDFKHAFNVVRLGLNYKFTQ